MISAIGELNDSVQYVNIIPRWRLPALCMSVFHVIHLHIAANNGNFIYYRQLLQYKLYYSPVKYISISL